MTELVTDILTYRLKVDLFIGCAFGSFVFMAVGILWVLSTKQKGAMRKVTGCLLAEYLWLMLCFTVLCRIMGEIEQFRPIPMYNFCDEHFTLGAILSECGLNVCLFVPIGLLVQLLCRCWWMTLLIGFGCSVSIEVLQWVCKCGCCEANDVINNTLGCALGTWCAHLSTQKMLRI